jgi:hypothetical protein
LIGYFETLGGNGNVNFECIDARVAIHFKFYFEL